MARIGWNFGNPWSVVNIASAPPAGWSGVRILVGTIIFVSRTSILTLGPTRGVPGSFPGIRVAQA